ncbi:MAG: T9SS type A sorting domain-containing protein [Candidatus Marinimicrobia bacterium]|nr:T9SS type A sorting domain-containing protein [Candidatus Neomarinimicrobiota bacterium]
MSIKIFFLLIFQTVQVFSITTFISPQNNYGNTEDEISINVNVNLDSVSIRGYKLSFKYDDEIIEFADAEVGELFEDYDLFWWQVVQDSANSVRVEYIILGGDTGIEEDGTILKLNFNGKKDGLSKLEFIDNELYEFETGEILATNYIDGKVIIDNERMLINNDVYLGKTYPNPFNNSVNIPIVVKEKTKINLSIYSIYGNRVKSLIAKSVPQNTFLNIKWYGKNNFGEIVTTGIYFVVLRNNSDIQTRKIIFIK